MLSFYVTHLPQHCVIQYVLSLFIYMVDVIFHPDDFRSLFTTK